LTAGWPVSPAALRKLLGEIGESSRRTPVLALGGEPDLASALGRELLRGGTDRAAVRVGEPEGSAVYVHVLAGGPGQTDIAFLRRARRARVPVLVVAAGDLGAGTSIPYVLATDVVRVERGQGLPLEALSRAIARRLGEDGAQLAARVPQLREAVCKQLVASSTRKNGLLGAAAWRRAGSGGGQAAAARPKGQAAKGGRAAADLPALTLNQLRLVLRLAQAHGEGDVVKRLPELAATLGAAFGLRSVARRLLELGGPVPGWTVTGAVAYAGTRALGEVALRRFAPAATPPPAVAAPGGP
jgi:hypothetical protein